jgi:hypothetical protein
MLPLAWTAYLKRERQIILIKFSGWKTSLLRRAWLIILIQRTLYLLPIFHMQASECAPGEVLHLLSRVITNSTPQDCFSLSRPFKFGQKKVFLRSFSLKMRVCWLFGIPTRNAGHDDALLIVSTRRSMDLSAEQVGSYQPHAGMFNSAQSTTIRGGVF